MLSIIGASGGYGDALVLRDIHLLAKSGEITCVMGRNGAGKTTLMRLIAALVRCKSGSIMLNSDVLSTLAPHQLARHGIGYVPQGRRLFGPMTVAENLAIGGLSGPAGQHGLNAVLTMFPRLKDRLGQTASTLSGGEQQMLAIGRAMCLDPKVLLLDEPTEGLQPSVTQLIRDAIQQLKQNGVTVILVEQRADAVLKLADQVCFMAHGQIMQTAQRADLTADSPLFHQYVGV